MKPRTPSSSTPPKRMSEALKGLKFMARATAAAEEEEAAAANKRVSHQPVPMVRAVAASVVQAERSVLSPVLQLQQQPAIARCRVALDSDTMYELKGLAGMVGKKKRRRGGKTTNNDEDDDKNKEEDDEEGVKRASEFFDRMKRQRLGGKGMNAQQQQTPSHAGRQRVHNERNVNDKQVGKKR